MGCHLRFALLLSLIGFALFVLAAERIPHRITQSNDSPTEFSERRARAIVNILARKPHAVGSQEHATVGEYIQHELQRLKLAVSEQQSDTAIRIAGSQQSSHVRNILGIVAGSDPDSKAIMLAAHYDSVANSRGASDDGAAVAALLETARAITAGPKLRRNIYFLFTDAEELGLLGAQAFVQEHPLAGRVGLVMNFEARGTSGPVLMYQTSPNNGQLIAAYGHAAPYPHSNSLINRLARILPNDADASIFVRAST
jgi:acetylornithine deacetylase/succinyl-diaminopimelate desuccinylase-like protein